MPDSTAPNEDERKRATQILWDLWGYTEDDLVSINTRAAVEICAHGLAANRAELDIRTKERDASGEREREYFALTSKTRIERDEARAECERLRACIRAHCGRPSCNLCDAIAAKPTGEPSDD